MRKIITAIGLALSLCGTVSGQHPLYPTRLAPSMYPSGNRYHNTAPVRVNVVVPVTPNTTAAPPSQIYWQPGRDGLAPTQPQSATFIRWWTFSNLFR